MKRTLLQLLLPVALITFCISACNKSDDGEHNTVTPGGSYTTLDGAISTAAPVTKTFSILVSTGDTFMLTGGARIGIPINPFETMAGEKVTGSVQVTYNEWPLKGDMIFGKVMPLNYGEPFASGGQVFISVTQNGQQLRLKAKNYIRVWLPQFGSALTSGTGYIGNEIIGSSNTVNWQPTDTNIIRPSLIAADTILLRSSTLGYLGVGTYSLPTGGARSSFTVKLITPVTLDQSMAVAMYDGYRSVYPLTGIEGGQVNVSRVPTLPMHIAVIGVKSGMFYGGYVGVPAPANDSLDTVVIKQIAPAVLKQQLDALR